MGRCCDSSSEKCCKPKPKCISPVKQCVNFGYWGAPRSLKCPVPKIYSQCEIHKIPTGSLYFAQRKDYIGTLRNLIDQECINAIGIILQVRNGNSKHTLVFTLPFGGTATLVPLASLINDPVIEAQWVRPLFPTCNKCTDEKRLRTLSFLISRFMNAPYERDGAQVARSIFGLPTQNPSCDSFTDTELVYRVLKMAGLLGDNCCPKYCNQPVPGACCNSTVNISTCSTLPCDDTCCESSCESNDCDDCEPDGYLATSAKISEFARQIGSCLDTCWFAPLVPVFTACPDGGAESAAINAAFSSQAGRITGAIRHLVDCWNCKKEGPCGCKTRCPPIIKDDCPCNGTTGASVSCRLCCNKVDPACAQAAIDGIKYIYSVVTDINIAGLPGTISATIDGAEFTAASNAVLLLLQTLTCECLDPIQVTTTGTVSKTVALVEPDTQPQINCAQICCNGTYFVNNVPVPQGVGVLGI